MKSDHPDGKFYSTQWTLVERASSGDVEVADEAIAEICKRYWAPLYVFARCKGMSEADAEDAVQIFFTELLDKRLIEKADSEKGKLRTFFLTVMDRTIKIKKRGESAQKRGGGQITFSIDQAREEQWYNSEPTESATPESLFEKRWALSVLEQALSSIREGYEKKGKEKVFDALKPHLGWSAGEESYGEVAKRLQMTEGAVKVAVYRLRQKYKETLQRQIADTIGTSDSELIREEITHLFSALS